MNIIKSLVVVAALLSKSSFAQPDDESIAEEVERMINGKSKNKQRFRYREDIDETNNGFDTHPSCTRPE